MFSILGIGNECPSFRISEHIFKIVEALEDVVRVVVVMASVVAVVAITRAVAGVVHDDLPVDDALDRAGLAVEA